MLLPKDTKTIRDTLILLNYLLQSHEHHTNDSYMMFMESLKLIDNNVAMNKNELIEKYHSAISSIRDTQSKIKWQMKHSLNKKQLFELKELYKNNKKDLKMLKKSLKEVFKNKF